MQQRSETHSTGTREETRAGTRKKLADSAHHLFVERGFDAVTVDEITEAAGLSRRTFFRHFPTKESAAFPEDSAIKELFCQALLEETGGRPVTMANLKNLLRGLVGVYMANADLMAERRGFIERSPALMAHELTVFMKWNSLIANAIDGTLTRSDPGDEKQSSPRARVVAGAIVGALVPTFWAWYDAGGEGDLAAMGLRVLDQLEQGLGPDLRLS